MRAEFVRHLAMSRATRVTLVIPTFRRPELLVRGHVFKQRCIITKQIGDGLQPLRQRCTNLRHRLEHADGVTRGGEQISNAMAHQTAADNAYFLRTHLYLPQSLLRGTNEDPKTLAGQFDPPKE